MENLDKEIGTQESEKETDLIRNSISAVSSEEQVTMPEMKVTEKQPENDPTNNNGNSTELYRILAAIETLVKYFQDLQVGFDTKIKYDTSSGKVIDSLHRELQTYRDGLHFQILRPLFFDLFSMHDDLSNLIKYNESVEGESESIGRLRQSLASFQETIESSLESHGVKAITEAGEQFVAKRQRVVRTEPTDNPEKDQLICDRVRKGFEYDGKVLRPETVVLYKFIENNAPSQKLS